MALKYRLVQRINPQKPTDPPKYYANVVTRGDVSLRELSKELSQISTVSTPDVLATIEALLEIIPRHLMQGEIVRLGEFGSFSVALSSEGAPAPEAFTSAQIKSLNLNFRPGKELGQMMAAVHFEKEQAA